jgi:hypothetical protein
MFLSRKTKEIISNTPRTMENTAMALADQLLALNLKTEQWIMFKDHGTAILEVFFWIPDMMQRIST